MRRWYLSLTLLGVGGLGALLLSDKGRAALRGMLRKFEEAPDKLLELNGTFQSELDRIQAALDRIADSLGLYPELGR